MAAELPVQDWADAWSEYRSIFDRWGLDEEKACGAVFAALAEVPARPGFVDRVCDALKEFTIRAQQRGEDDLRAGLGWAAGRLAEGEPIERHTRAVQLFGTAAEDLGPDVCRRLAEHLTVKGA